MMLFKTTVWYSLDACAGWPSNNHMWLLTELLLVQFWLVTVVKKAGDTPTG